jgi:putative hydrolase of the HAD superfamily
MPSYEHLFFDLDHTLWDFETNSAETLRELFVHYNLAEKGIPSAEAFIQEYRLYNERMWDLYRRNLVDKGTLRSKRFLLALEHFGIKDRKLAHAIEHDYVSHAPFKTNLMPDTLEVLSYLKQRYVLHIITNGFSEIQFIKIKQSSLADFFSEVITSETAGVRKPNPYIFRYAMRKGEAEPHNSIMIGDSLEADIIGARSVGMDQIFYNPAQKPHNETVTYEIRELKELKGIL